MDQKTLKEVLRYEPETGEFYWLKRTSIRNKVGGRAGFDASGGRRTLIINYVKYKAHRLAWLYMTGDWPPNEIDHIDGNPANNRFSNLRLATHAENARNTNVRRHSSSGIKGVDWFNSRQKWRARIRHNNQIFHLGYFDTAEDASKAYQAASKRLHGEFSYFNSRETG